MCMNCGAQTCATDLDECDNNDFVTTDKCIDNTPYDCTGTLTPKDIDPDLLAELLDLKVNTGRRFEGSINYLAFFDNTQPLLCPVTKCELSIMAFNGPEITEDGSSFFVKTDDATQRDFTVTCRYDGTLAGRVTSNTVSFEIKDEADPCFVPGTVQTRV